MWISHHAIHFSALSQPLWGMRASWQGGQALSFAEGVCGGRLLDAGGGGVALPYIALWGRLKRSAGAVQLFGRLAVLETHTL